MRKLGIFAIIFAITISCNTEKSNTKSEVEEFKEKEFTSHTLTKHLKPFNPELPTHGLFNV